MQMLIGGKHVDSYDRATMQVTNPANLQLIDTVPCATEEDVNLALDNAVKGFKEWSGIPLYERINVIKKFLDLYKQHEQELIGILSAETGKTVRFTTWEVCGTANMIEHFIEAARTFGSDALPVGNHAGGEHSLRVVVREPLGVVVAILPYNYPIDVISHKAIPALLMGNAVVLKPAGDTPLANIRYCELLLEAGVPGNAIQILTGSGSKMGKWLVDDARVNLVSMTGSTETGIEIAKNAAPHLHHLSLELGGNSPHIILEDADVDAAVAESIFGRILHTGQVCSAPKRFVVANSIKQKYTDKLIAALKELKMGEPSDPESDCGPLTSIKAAKQVETQINLAIEQGGKLLYGGHRYNETYIELTVLEVSPETDVAKDDEIFGPVWPIIGFDTIEEAIAIANNSSYGLSAGVNGKDMATMMKVTRALQAGSCVMNGSSCYRDIDQPFGGFKGSGVGREGGTYTLEEMTQVRTLIFKNCY